MRDLWFLIILSGFIQQSCSRFNNQTQSLALECGVSADQARENHFLKLVDESANELSPEEISSLKIEIEYQNLTSNPRVNQSGCVVIPSNVDMIIKAYSLSSKKSAVKRINTGRPNNLTKIVLNTSPDVQLEDKCSKDGLFANLTLGHPYFLSIKGNSEPIGIKITATSQEDNSKYILFEKPLGSLSIGLPPTISIDALSQGVYSLRITKTDIVGNFLENNNILSINDCPLTIIRNMPALNLTQSTTSPAIEVLRKGEKFPIEPLNPKDSIYVCQEDKSETGLQNFDNCIAGPKCMAVENFNELIDRKIQQAGESNYFSFISDRAGNKSAISCNKIVVVDTKTNLEIAWKNNKWNTDGGEVLKDLPAYLEAQFIFSSAQLPKDYLEKNLSCKIEFLVNGTTTLKGDDVECLSGSCTGLKMGDFVPCNSNLKFSITEIWKQKSVSNSLMRLVAKIEDGTGAEIIAKNSLWLNEASRSLKEISHDKNGMKFPMIRQLFSDQQGNLAFATSNDELVSPIENSFTHHLSPPGSKRIVGGMVRDRLGGIYHFLKSEKSTNSSEEASRDLVFKWDGSSWIPREIVDVPTSECSMFLPHSKSGIWCISMELEEGNLTQKVEINYFNGVGWLKSEPFTVEANSCGINRIYTDAQDKSWFSCESKIYVGQPQGKWEMQQVDGLSNASNVVLFQDVNERIWAYCKSNLGALLLGRIESGKFNQIKLPPELKTENFDFLYNFLNVGDQERIILGSFEFNGKWQRIPEIEELFVGRNLIKTIKDLNGKDWAVTELGLSSIGSDQNVFYPIANYGLRCDRPQTFCEFLKNSDGSLWIRSSSEKSFDYRLYKIESKPYAFFGNGLTGLIDGVSSTIEEVDGMVTFKSSAPFSNLVSFQDGQFRDKGIPLFDSRSNILDKLGRSYIDSEDGFMRYNLDGTSELFPKPNSEKSKRVGFASEVNGDVWFTWGQPSALLRVRDSKIEKFYDERLNDAKIFAISESYLMLSILTNKGIFKFDIPTEKFGFIQYEGLDFSVIDESDAGMISSLKNRDLIFGFYNFSRKPQLFRLNSEDGSFSAQDLALYDGSGNMDVPFSVFETKSGELGAFGWQGLYLRKQDKWSPAISSAMLSSDGFESGFHKMYRDRFDRYWMTTDFGVIRVPGLK